MNPAEAFDLLLSYALAFPGAHEDHPWGETVAKVDGKVFVFFGHPDSAKGDLTFSLKLPKTGGHALQGKHATPTGYGLGKSGWVSFRYPPDEVPVVEELRAMVDESWYAVAKKRRIKAWKTADRQRS